VKGFPILALCNLEAFAELAKVSIMAYEHMPGRRARDGNHWIGGFNVHDVSQSCYGVARSFQYPTDRIRYVLVRKEWDYHRLRRITPRLMNPDKRWLPLCPPR
jgi:hypothetical protein